MVLGITGKPAEKTEAEIVDHLLSKFAGKGYITDKKYSRESKDPICLFLDPSRRFSNQV